MPLRGLCRIRRLRGGRRCAERHVQPAHVGYRQLARQVRVEVLAFDVEFDLCSTLQY
jgi:hypothetical protein